MDITTDKIALRELRRLVENDPSRGRLNEFIHHVIKAVGRSFKSGAHPMRKPTEAEARRRAKILVDAYGRAVEQQGWPTIRFYDYMSQVLDRELDGTLWIPPEGRLWMPHEYQHQTGGLLQ